jgi:Cd2+/Zn2+-exporting ATPase
VGYFKNAQSILTGLCGLFLVVSLFPGLEHWAIASVVFGSYFAFKSAWESIRERSIDVNVLMLLAAVGAVLLDEERDAAALLFLFSLSSTLESLAMAKTRNAIEGLIRLRPDRAVLVTAEGDTVVPVERLKVGDRVRVIPYENVPADGTVVSGESEVNQAAMTGESVPVPKSMGDKLLAGTQNLQGMLVMQVSEAVENSTLTKIVALVQEAQQNKASGERISQWFGQRYTFVVVAVFLVSLAVRTMLNEPLHEAARASLTLLVALSPCALVISTPASTLSALTWAARHGILVRGGSYIEAAGKVDTLALDKTGTLTAGRPELVEICVCSSLVPAGCRQGEACWSSEKTMSSESRRMLGIAAAVEQYSTHPIAEAVLRKAAEEGIAPIEAEAHSTASGLGVQATIEGKPVRLGQRRFFAQEFDEHFDDHVQAFEERGLTVSIMEIDGHYAALGFRDVPRPEASQFVASVRELGVDQVVMLTGDTPATAEAVGKEVGVDASYAGLLPTDKAKQIAGFTERGRRVMMVGDGVNDAPSLAAATVGVAMGGLGSDIALNAADVVLMQDRLTGIPNLIKLGQRTNMIIRANLFFAVGVIAVLTILSFSGVLPLWVAVLGHEGSTVLVILNGLRLLAGPM